MNTQESKAFNEFIEKLGEVKEQAKSKMNEFLKDKTVEDMKESFRSIKSNSLLAICEQIASEDNRDDICQAVQEVIEERKKIK